MTNIRSDSADHAKQLPSESVEEDVSLISEDMDHDELVVETMPIFSSQSLLGFLKGDPLMRDKVEILCLKDIKDRLDLNEIELNYRNEK
jgi:hypothetical protein